MPPKNYDSYGKKHSVEVLFDDVGPDREAIERELIESGVPLPLPHRCVWARAHAARRSWFLAVRDAHGRYCCGFAVAVGESRALPGHLILRAEKFGVALSDEARAVSLVALADLARHHRRILRVELEVFSKDSALRNAVGTLVSTLGFRRRQDQRSYGRTLVMDLGPEESKIFASLSSSARQNIRAVQKGAWSVRCITEERWAEHIELLLKEAFVRTGGEYPKWDWSSIIRLGTRNPTLSRVTGLFGAERSGSEKLLAFAWGRSHGDHAEYAESGSTRSTDARAPLSHALVWDLVCWAKRGGAIWFDLGGVTEGGLDHEDPLAGISHFKRFFSKTVATVGEEWVLEPRYVRARVAEVASTTAGWIRAASGALR